MTSSATWSADSARVFMPPEASSSTAACSSILDAAASAFTWSAEKPVGCTSRCSTPKCHHYRTLRYERAAQNPPNLLASRRQRVQDRLLQAPSFQEGKICRLTPLSARSLKWTRPEALEMQKAAPDGDPRQVRFRRHGLLPFDTCVDALVGRSRSGLFPRAPDEGVKLQCLEILWP